MFEFFQSVKNQKCHMSSCGFSFIVKDKPVSECVLGRRGKNPGFSSLDLRGQKCIVLVNRRQPCCISDLCSLVKDLKVMSGRLNGLTQTTRDC